MFGEHFDWAILSDLLVLHRATRLALHWAKRFGRSGFIRLPVFAGCG
ncbi:MAG: hypothetical protein GDA36_13940 [Rhodobacteraceae bacterium]|nr:hypothetical protein [Paracoccaceae bacterium]